jgi:hypothetical protein
MLYACSLKKIIILDSQMIALLVDLIPGALLSLGGTSHPLK